MNPVTATTASPVIPTAAASALAVADAEPTPLVDARAQLAEAIDLLGYGDGLHRMIATPRREMAVAVPLRPSSEPGAASSPGGSSWK